MESKKLKIKKKKVKVQGTKCSLGIRESNVRNYENSGIKYI